MYLYLKNLTLPDEDTRSLKIFIYFFKDLVPSILSTGSVQDVSKTGVCRPCCCTYELAVLQPRNGPSLPVGRDTLGSPRTLCSDRRERKRERTRDTRCVGQAGEKCKFDKTGERNKRKSLKRASFNLQNRV